MTYITDELMWIHHFLVELKLPPPDLMELWHDNQAVICTKSNIVFQECTEHIKADWKFIWDKFQAQIITIVNMSFEDQLADLFTKSLYSLGDGHL